MADYAAVRCLFCTTGREMQVARHVEELGIGRALFPQRVKTVVKDRRETGQWTPLLPGYVFVY